MSPCVYRPMSRPVRLVARAGLPAKAAETPEAAVEVLPALLRGADANASSCAARLLRAVFLGGISILLSGTVPFDVDAYGPFSPEKRKTGKNPSGKRTRGDSKAQKGKKGRKNRSGKRKAGDPF